MSCQPQHASVSFDAFNGGLKNLINMQGDEQSNHCWRHAHSNGRQDWVVHKCRDSKAYVLFVCKRSYMASEDLVLDRKVRDWVVVPLTLCILLMMLLRQYVAKVRTSYRFVAPQLIELLSVTYVFSDRCWQVRVPASRLLTPKNCGKNKHWQGRS